MDGRLPINEEVELAWKDWPPAVYRVGQECTLWFIHMAAPSS
jgi:hypothetical protein